MTKKSLFHLFFLISLFSLLPANAQKKPTGTPAPPMGWNSWYFHGKVAINEKIVMETIDAMVSEGLRDAGYTYLIIDGGWRDTKLGPNGELIVNPVKFPNGMKPLADYAHSKGLKFGLHTVPGTHDCGGDEVGGFNREEIHIRQFVEWELDFVKVDLCTQKADPCTECEKNFRGWSEKTIEETYTKWGKLLSTCGREILYSISAYEFRDWNPEVCNMSRTTGDIQGRIHEGGAIFNRIDGKPEGRFHSVMEIAEINNRSAAFMGNGYWNDPDYLVVGKQGLSETEQISHFALWCIMTSPLILSNDPRFMSPQEKALLLNREMIAINQDPSEQGKIIKSIDNTQVWAKHLSNGKVAVLLLNLDIKGTKDVSVELKDLGFNGKVNVRDVVNHKDLGRYNKTIALPAGTNQSWFLVLTR